MRFNNKKKSWKALYPTLGFIGVVGTFLSFGTPGGTLETGCGGDEEPIITELSNLQLQHLKPPHHDWTSAEGSCQSCHAEEYTNTFKVELRHGDALETIVLGDRVNDEKFGTIGLLSTGSAFLAPATSRTFAVAMPREELCKEEHCIHSNAPGATHDACLQSIRAGQAHSHRYMSRYDLNGSGIVMKLQPAGVGEESPENMKIRLVEGPEQGSLQLNGTLYNGEAWKKVLALNEELELDRDTMVNLSGNNPEDWEVHALDELFKENPEACTPALLAKDSTGHWRENCQALSKYNRFSLSAAGDSDSDGVPDHSDACLWEVGLADAAGCPSGDGMRVQPPGSATHDDILPDINGNPDTSPPL